MPAPAPAHASKPIAISQEDYWARAAQYFSSAASQVRCTVPLSWLAPQTTCSQQCVPFGDIQVRCIVPLVVAGPQNYAMAAVSPGP